MSQLIPLERAVPQVFVSMNSAAFVPPTLMAVIESCPLPVFFSVIVRAALAGFAACEPKATVAGLALTIAAAIPVPLKVIVWGLPGALSVTFREAFFTLADVGWNVTEIVQVPPAATEPPQLCVSATERC